MPLPVDLATHLQQTLLISVAVKQQITAGWDTFSSAKQAAISDLVMVGSDTQSALLTHCVAANPNFAEGFGAHVENAKSDALKRYESEAHSDEDATIAQMMADIDAM